MCLNMPEHEARPNSTRMSLNMRSPIQSFMSSWDLTGAWAPKKWPDSGPLFLGSGPVLTSKLRKACDGIGQRCFSRIGGFRISKGPGGEPKPIGPVFEG